jgi:hypothetical protein
MSDKEARVLKDARREQADRLKAEAKAVADAAPKPREVLVAVTGELTGARAEEGRLEAAAANAREQLVQARTAMDMAEEALLIARNRLAETAVERCFDTASVRKPSRGVAAEMAAVEAARSGLELATTAANTLADMLSDVGYQLRRLEKRHREAALAVLSDECSPLLLPGRARRDQNSSWPAKAWPGLSMPEWRQPRSSPRNCGGVGATSPIAGRPAISVGLISTLRWRH